MVQLTRALEQIATLPGTPALRREQLKLQLAIISPLSHVKGYAAAEPKAALEQARLLIEQAEARGEPLEDPVLLFSILCGFWLANYVGGNYDAAHELAVQVLASAEKQRAPGQLVTAHSLMGATLATMGDIAEGRAHLDQAIALHDPTEHRPLAARSGQAARLSILCNRSLALWLLGYPEAALRDTDEALRNAREIGHAARLLPALLQSSMSFHLCGNRTTAAARAAELVALAEEKGLVWKSAGMMLQGAVLALDGSASDAIERLASGMTAYRTTGAHNWTPFYLPHLARSHAQLGEFDEAWRCIREAMNLVETSKEKWCAAEIHRAAGDIVLMSPESDAEKAQAHFERAVAIAREQQAKSWELRAATSLARLWCDQGRRPQARALLAPIHAWFTEGFDTSDLIQAKTLLA